MQKQSKSTVSAEGAAKHNQAQWKAYYHRAARIAAELAKTSEVAAEAYLRSARKRFHIETAAIKNAYLWADEEVGHA